MAFAPKDTLFYSKKTLNAGGTLLDLSNPKVMGILNVTPDSFYSSSRASAEKDFLELAGKMMEQGADIIDIGGYSTRPGAKEISLEEEIIRTIPCIKKLIATFPGICISIDTFRSKVAYAAVNEGATMINDVSGGNLDDEMFSMVAKLQVPYVLMHMRGTPETMMTLNSYENLTREVIAELEAKVFQLRQLNVKDIIIDPGFGFAKNGEQNFLLLKNLELFKIFELPLLVGISRKSLVWKTLGLGADEALNGTTVLNTYALLNGANILRVHDVKEAKEAIILLKSVFN